MSQADYHRPEARSEQTTQSCSQSVRELHQLYCHWTAQTLSLRFDRERLWYEFLRAGFNAQDLKRVFGYLQKEIRSERRNIGALKLPICSNSIDSRKISTSAAPVSGPQLRPPNRPSSHHLSRKIDDKQRHKISEQLRIFRHKLGRNDSAS